MDRRRRRKLFVTMGVAALAVGAFVVLYRGPARELIRGHLGDVAATMFVYAVLGLVLARVRIGVRAAVTLAIASAIELGQTVWRTNSLAGELVLGTTFDPWDLLAYALGVAVAIVWESRNSARTAAVARIIG